MLAFGQDLLIDEVVDRHPDDPEDPDNVAKDVLPKIAVADDLKREAHPDPKQKGHRDAKGIAEDLSAHFGFPVEFLESDHFARFFRGVFERHFFCVSFIRIHVFFPLFRTPILYRFGMMPGTTRKGKSVELEALVIPDNENPHAYFK